jgi:hypothetical protein
MKRLKISLFVYFAIGFVFLVLFIPKNSSVVGTHSLVVSCFIFLVFFTKNKKNLSFIFENALSAIKGVVVIVSTFFLFVLFTTGYLQAINGLIGNQENICLSGEIVKKYEDKGRFEGVNYYVAFIPQEADQEDTARVSLEEFRKNEVGGFFEKSWRKGLLGYLHLNALGDGPGTVRYKGCKNLEKEY